MTGLGEALGQRQPAAERVTERRTDRHAARSFAAQQTGHLDVVLGAKAHRLVAQLARHARVRLSLSRQSRADQHERGYHAIQKTAPRNIRSSQRMPGLFGRRSVRSGGPAFAHERRVRPAQGAGRELQLPCLLHRETQRGPPGEPGARAQVVAGPLVQHPHLVHQIGHREQVCRVGVLFRWFLVSGRSVGLGRTFRRHHYPLIISYCELIYTLRYGCGVPRTSSPPVPDQNQGGEHARAHG